MTCCIEDAMKAAVEAFVSSPIKDRNVFLVERIGAEEETPYCVIQCVTREGRKSSDGCQKVYGVSIQAFFLKNKVADALGFKSLIEEWLYGSNCVALGDCGCFCVQSRADSKVVPQNDGKLRYEVSFTGTYQQSAGS